MTDDEPSRRGAPPDEPPPPENQRSNSSSQQPGSSRRHPRRNNSTASSAPSAASSSAQTDQSATRRKMQRHYRPRPVNLAGPSYRQDSALQMSPDYRASFQSGHSTDGDGSAMASGDESVSGSIGRGSLLAGKSAAKKPLWAIGGVFPKHERHRRSTTGTQASGRPRNDSSAGRETDSSGRRESAPQQSRRDSRRSSRGARKDSHTRQGSRQQDRRPAVDTITGGVTPGSQVIESDIETQGDWGVSERPDPFEDQQTVPASGTKPLDVVVSNDSGRSREPERSDSPPGRTAAPESRDRPGLEDDRASEGSSPTIFDEARPDEKRGKHEHTEDEAESIEHERDADDGHDTENTGQALGGKLDQRSDEWQDDTGEDLPIRNRWGMVRYALREPFAEFLGERSRARPAVFLIVLVLTQLRYCAGTLVLVVIGVGCKSCVRRMEVVRLELTVLPSSATCQTKLSQSQVCHPREALQRACLTCVILCSTAPFSLRTGHGASES